MKARVNMTYIDKYSRKTHLEGEIIELSKKRFEEINGAGLDAVLMELRDEQDGKNA